MSSDIKREEESIGQMISDAFRMVVKEARKDSEDYCPDCGGTGILDVQSEDDDRCYYCPDCDKGNGGGRWGYISDPEMDQEVADEYADEYPWLA